MLITIHIQYQDRLLAKFLNENVIREIELKYSMSFFFFNEFLQN